jgi:hypothetical protein
VKKEIEHGEGIFQSYSLLENKEFHDERLEKNIPPLTQHNAIGIWLVLEHGRCHCCRIMKMELLMLLLL